MQGWLKPDALFGDLLLPGVSLAVALILYEGGLTLKISELKKVGSVVRNLVTIGAAVTWIGSGLAAHYVLGLPVPLAALLGAILMVTGPTVISPMLRHIRPSGAVGPILKWEGIVIDPIGALAALLVFEAVLIDNVSEAAGNAALAIGKTIMFGGGIGLAAAALLTLAVSRFWLADHLQNAVSLMLVMAAFTLSNLLQGESGLLAVTVMGFVLANQKRADVTHIFEFKENLQVLLVSSLFIILAARLAPESLAMASLDDAIFILILILLIRPAGIFLSSIGSKLSMREKLFLCCMAPRGIVAAAVSSVFALRLMDMEYAGARELAPAMFFVIIATVAVYGLAAPWMARSLGVAEAHPQGVLIIGAHEWARKLAVLLKDRKFTVRLIDNNWENVNEARMLGLTTYAGSALDERLLATVDLGGIGRVLAMTPNDWVNSLAAKRFEHILGKVNCYQLVPDDDALNKEQAHSRMHGRLLFGQEATYDTLRMREFDGYQIKATRLTDEFNFDDYVEEYRGAPLPMFIIDAKGRLHVLRAEEEVKPEAGQTIIGFVKERRRTDATQIAQQRADIPQT